MKVTGETGVSSEGSFLSDEVSEADRVSKCGTLHLVPKVMQLQAELLTVSPRLMRPL